MFDAEVKKARHETVFPTEKQKAFDLGADIVKISKQFVRRLYSLSNDVYSPESEIYSFSDG